MESETVAGGDTAAVLDLGRLSGLRRHCEAGARATQEAVVLGIIDFGNEGSKNVVTAPTTVAVGEEFKRTITTFGGGCEREGTSGTIITATGATIMVYDITSAVHPGVICTAEIKRLPHSSLPTAPAR
ncbi:MAG TPA: hypothetical protein VF089_21760 [Candidatus Binatia bacterium]